MENANPLNDRPKYTPEEVALIEQTVREFSAADLQLYTEDDDDQLIPIEDVLAELEQAHEGADACSPTCCDEVTEPNNPPSQPTHHVWDAETAALYEQVKREFSAADLQLYTVDEELIPIEQVLAELEADDELSADANR